MSFVYLVCFVVKSFPLFQRGQLPTAN